MHSILFLKYELKQHLLRYDMGTTQGLSYWLQWQVPLCALVFLAPALLAFNYLTTQSASPPLKSFHLWNSCWTNLNPLWLFLYRVAAFLCLAFILCTMLSLSGVFAFYFYTQWTFALVTFYFALASVISGYGCWMSAKKASPEEGEEEDDEFKEKIKLNSPHARTEIRQKAGFWGHSMQAVYHTCAGACVLTDLVFWCLLVPLQANVAFELTFLIGCLHTVNAAFLIGDTALNALPLGLFGFAHFVLWSCVYITFQWLIHASAFMTWWPYPFLELDTPWAPLWYVGMALFHVPCYGVYVLLVKAKHSLLPRLFPQAFARLN